MHTWSQANETPYEGLFPAAPAAYAVTVGQSKPMFPMLKIVSRRTGAALALAVSAALMLPAAAAAQSGDQKPDAKAQSDGREIARKRFEEISEVGRLLSGPAANPECVWLGRRVISLLWRDDLDTAFRHLDLYDRFGCPSGHVQTTFRCLVRLGDIDAKAPPDTLNTRIHACWINPAVQQVAQPAAPNPADAGTTSR
jgi:hypothetical protein